jgi:hypothetical protein
MDKVANKMYSLAKRYGALNEDGKVKKFGGNEKGYAKIYRIAHGCWIEVHHMKGGERADRLIIDLLITCSARKREPEKCKKAVDEFQKYFKDKPERKPWQHCLTEGDKRDRYAFDVTEQGEAEIVRTLDGLCTALRNV